MGGGKPVDNSAEVRAANERQRQAEEEAQKVKDATERARKGRQGLIGQRSLLFAGAEGVTDRLPGNLG